MTNNPSQRIYRIALLVSISCVLQISESMIPHPIPGLRLGLANMLTLVALVALDFSAAMQIAVYRTLLSSFIIGTFMTPTFILSFSSACVSTLVMGLFYRLSRLHERYGFSIIGISVAGALTHNMVQLFLAYLILIRHRGIFVFFPWLAIGGVVMGWITGIVAGSVCQRLDEIQASDTEMGHWSFVNGHLPNEQSQMTNDKFQMTNDKSQITFLHTLPASIKIGIICILAIIIFMINNFLFYAGLFFALALVAKASQTPFSFLFSRIRKYAFLIGLAFLLPLFFNSGTHILFDAGAFQITHEGLAAGTLYALRILFLILTSALLMRTTSPEQMTQGLATLFSPVKYFGFSEKNIAMTLSLSWNALPEIWETARQSIREAQLTKPKNLRNLIPLLSNLIAMLYLGAEPKSKLWGNIYASQDKHE